MRLVFFLIFDFISSVCMRDFSLANLLQSISGITVAQYYSARNYSLTLRSTIASCMTYVRVVELLAVLLML